MTNTMTREQATRLTHESLQASGLKDWHVRINTNVTAPYVGLCLHKDKAIVLNAHHIDTHPDVEVRNTILHEVAHALTPGHGHDDVWAAKAKEIGCDNTLTVCSMALDMRVIEAIRSGADVEVEFDEQVIRTPKYRISKIRDKCEYCGKVAVTVSETKIPVSNPDRPDLMFIKLECGHTIIKNLPKGTPFYKLQYGGDITCEHEWNKNECIKCGRFKPYDFQIKGMEFGEVALAVNSGVAILDEMGLGKTIQAGGIVKFHPELWPVLWVVKSGLKFQFFKFLLDWLGEDHVAQIINSGSDILIPGLKHYIISYDMMTPKVRKLKSGKIITQGFDIQKIIKSDIKTIVLDECQQIKNVDSARTRQVEQICRGRKVIALSGTPWKNRGGELYSVMRLIDRNRFDNHQRFLDQWVEFYYQGQFRKQGGIRNPARFKEYIKDIAIRRERKEVMPELPTTTRTKLNVSMTTAEDKEYDQAVEDFVAWYTTETDVAKGGINILGKISRLRHITGVAKIPATMNYIEDFIEDTDKKLVIFVHHKDVGQSLYYQCKEKFEKAVKETEDSSEREAIPVFQLTSEQDGEERHKIQTLFNETKRCILIASTLASGEGLNLQTASDCMMHERQWNPANEEQAEGRFVRIGQKAPEINAVYVQVVESIDQFLDQIVERKRRYFHAAMNTGEAPKWNQDEILKELADVIVRKHREKTGK